MALLLIDPDDDVREWRDVLAGLDPKVEVRVWPEAGDRAAVEMAVTWNHPPGELRRYPNLRCICSMGAGVDHVFRDADLPPGVPVVRLVDERLSRSMAEYVALAVLQHLRGWEIYRSQQRAGCWRQHRPPRAGSLRVGIAGLGVLGTAVAGVLAPFGFTLAGWARSRKRIEGVRCYAGDAEFAAFLEGTNVLVCLLPLTRETRGILNRDTFEGLARGAYLINAARGAHLVEADLIRALDGGLLSGACLDVFHDEPLPAGHPFWSHPRVIVTPHVSSLTDVASVAPQILDNYRRTQRGEPLANVVDPQRGY